MIEIFAWFLGCRIPSELFYVSRWYFRSGEANNKKVILSSILKVLTKNKVNFKPYKQKENRKLHTIRLEIYSAFQKSKCSVRELNLYKQERN